MNESTIQLDIPLLLPDLDEPCDGCVARLEKMLGARKGVRRVHVKHNGQLAQLCLHYDPNLVSLTAIRRLAQEAGSDFTERYRHEQIPFSGMDVADAAGALAQTLEDLPGMLHASINYAAGLAFVAYDTEVLRRTGIEEAIHHMGYQPLPPPAMALRVETEAPPASSIQALIGRILENRSIISVILAGLFLLVGWTGSRYLGLPDGTVLFFFALSYLAGGYDVAGQAIPRLLKGHFDTDVLMLAAAGGAVILGAWAEGGFLLFLFSLGHAGEHYALGRARQAVSALGELMPKTALVKRDGQVTELPVGRLAIGDVVLVRPGDRIPVDGEIIQGTGSVDQSAITGESLPVTKGVSDEVFAGTVLRDAAIQVRVSNLAEDNTLSRIMGLVAEAQEGVSPTQQLTGRFTAVFVPAILILVILVALVPPIFRWMPFEESVYRALLLLIAASPCALAIGTPATVLAGIAQAARNGVLIKGGVHLENLGAVKAMAFDKTGTLTEGNFQVTDVHPLNGVGADELLRMAAAVELQANHPLAQAVVRTARELELAIPVAGNLHNLAGLGVRCEVDGFPVAIGSIKLFSGDQSHPLDEQIIQAVSDLESAGKTTMIVGCNGQIMGFLALADTPRPGIKETMERLLALGVERLVMLTGDNQNVAQRIGRAIGVTEVKAGLMPGEKLEALESLKEAHGSVAMIGDGINDAPALAAATVGIAMGGAGTAVALETADVALMADDLAKLPFAVGLSRAGRRIIKQNLAIALGIIGILVLVSVLGVVQLSGAVILHEGSTILVVLNALRLLSYRDR